MAHSYLILKPVPPFRLDLTAWALRRRTQNNIDLFNNGVYKRVLVLEDQRIGIAVKQRGSIFKPVLQIKLSKKILKTAQKTAVNILVEKLLGTQLDLGDFYEFSAHDKNLGALVRKFSGFKPPRFPSVFEAAVNGICCQQLSLVVGLTVLNRLALECSEPLDNDGELMYAFPEPQEISQLKMARMLKLGLSTNKAKALLELSKNIEDGNISLKDLDALDDEQAIAKLMTIRGIGRWTAEYVLLRGLGRVHIYPGDDVGFQNGLKKWLKLRSRIDYSMVHNIMSKWPRYGGMIYFHLLLERLRSEKLI